MKTTAFARSLAAALATGAAVHVTNGQIASDHGLGMGPVSERAALGSFEAPPAPEPSASQAWSFEEVWSLDRTPFHTELTVDDFDQDGLPDMLAVENHMAPGGTVWSTRAVLFRNKGGWQFSGRVVVPLMEGYGYAPVSGDLNGDSWPDLVLSGGCTTVLLNDRNGGFIPVCEFDGWGTALDLHDMNGDGSLDLLLASAWGPDGAHLGIHANSGDGTTFTELWDSGPYGGSSTYFRWARAAQLTQDGVADVVAISLQAGLERLFTFVNDGQRSSYELREERVPFRSRFYGLGVGRVDGADSPLDYALEDVAVHDSLGANGGGRLRVYRSTGDGYLSVYWYSPDIYPSGAANLFLADFNRDGYDDLFAACGAVPGYPTATPRVYRNTGDSAGFELAWTGSAPAGYVGAVADMDNDGLLDLISGEQHWIRILRNTSGFTTPCRWDLDGDGSVGVTDLREVAGKFGPCLGCPQDLNGDGIVDEQDARLVAAHFGACPEPTSL